MEPAHAALKKALESPEVLEAVALSEQEPEKPSSVRVLRAVETARKILALAEGGNHIHSGLSVPPMEGEG